MEYFIQKIKDIFLCAYQDIHKRDNSLMNIFYT